VSGTATGREGFGLIKAGYGDGRTRNEGLPIARDVKPRRARVLRGHTDRPRLRFVPGLGHGRRNPMVARVRELMHVHTTNLKQPGRRYGPSPQGTERKAS
jgi:hypothetical protein